MGQVNRMMVELIEAVLDAKGQTNNDEMFTQLSERLMADTAGFWAEYKDVIPERFHPLFRKQQ